MYDIESWWETELDAYKDAVEFLKREVQVLVQRK
jgi:hypothetical protein